jgi:F420-dependent oxidoreductase-like protein
MRLGLQLGYWMPDPWDPTDLVLEAERLGYDSAWTAEAYGSDCVSTLAWIGARTTKIKLGTSIMQMSARTPACTAMTAVTLDHLSGGRFLLGLGVSGPQVVEGWHGQAFGRPIRRTREYVDIVRAILRRDKPIEFHGEYYSVPYTGPDATGLGKPLRSILHGRADLPIYLAAIGPKNVALAAEVGDGWIPVFFSPHRAPIFRAWLESGFVARGQRPPGFDVMPMVAVAMGPDVAACRAVLKANLALYIGGMGARGRNFYNDLARRYGYEDAAQRIQDLYLSGRKADAAAGVPDALVDEVALCGPRERIRDQLAAWRESVATTILASTRDVATLRTLAELLL